MSIGVQYSESLERRLYEYGVGEGIGRSADHSLRHTVNRATGTSANQQDLCYDSRTAFPTGKTLTATSENVDLVGSLSSAFGATLSVAKVTEVWVRFRSYSAGGQLIFGAAASQEWVAPFGASGDKVKVDPGFESEWIRVFFAPVNGFAAAAGTTDFLKIDSGSATIVYDLVILGRSA